MKKIKLDHVERLSRGKRSGINVGSRSVGHHLRPFERAHYARALTKGYLEITEKDRVNLWHIWQKACIAQDWIFLLLIKDMCKAVGTIYQGDSALDPMPLAESKRLIKELANCNVR